MDGYIVEALAHCIAGKCLRCPMKPAEESRTGAASVPCLDFRLGHVKLPRTLALNVLEGLTERRAADLLADSQRPMDSFGEIHARQGGRPEQTARNVEFTIVNEITKKEFLEATHTREDCWLFRDPDLVRRYFRAWLGRELVYVYDDGEYQRRLFRDMPEDGEVWVAEQDRNTGRITGLWSTWEVYD